MCSPAAPFWDRASRRNNLDELLAVSSPRLTAGDAADLAGDVVADNYSDGVGPGPSSNAFFMSIPLARMDAHRPVGQVRIDCLAYGSRRFAALAVVDVGSCSKAEVAPLLPSIDTPLGRHMQDELNLLLFFFLILFFFSPLRRRRRFPTGAQERRDNSNSRPSQRGDCARVSPVERLSFPPSRAYIRKLRTVV